MIERVGVGGTCGDVVFFLSLSVLAISSSELSTHKSPNITNNARVTSIYIIYFCVFPGDSMFFNIISPNVAKGQLRKAASLLLIFRFKLFRHICTGQIAQNCLFVSCFLKKCLV